MPKDIIIIPASGQIEFSGSSTHHNVLTVDSSSMRITTDEFRIVGGNIVAENFVVSSSVTHLTQSFSSGSTIFGDTTDDTHKFIGHITASGNISSSGTGNNILGGNLYFDGDTTISTVGGSDDISINPDAELNLGTAGSDEINIGRSSGTCDINMFANTATVAARFVTSTITFNHPVTASGEISSSNRVIAKRFNADGALEGAGGYAFRKRDDTGMYETGFSVGVLAPENVQIAIDSNNNNNDISDPAQFVVVHNNSVLDSSPANPLFQVFEDGRTLFSTASVAGVTINSSPGHITASGNISSSGYVYADRVYVENKLALSHGDTAGAVRLGYTNDIPIEIGRNAGNSTSFTGHITASGNISASGGNHTFGGDVTIGLATQKGLKVSDGTTTGMLSINDTSLVLQGSTANPTDDTNTAQVLIDANANMTLNKGTTSGGSLFTEGHITASGNISSSGNILTSGNITSLGTITGNSLVGTLGTAAQTNITSVGTLGSLDVTGNITTDGIGRFDGVQITGSIDFKGTAQPTIKYNGDTVMTFTTDPGSQEVIQIPVGRSIYWGAIGYTGNTGIGANSNDPESLLVQADQDITFKPDNASYFYKTGAGGTAYQLYISASGAHPKVGIGTDTPTTALQVTGDISASGFISASGNLYGSDLYLTGNDIFNDGLRKISMGSSNMSLYAGTGGGVYIRNQDTSVASGQTYGEFIFVNDDNEEDTAKIRVIATENHAQSAAGGSKIDFQAMANGVDSTDSDLFTTMTFDPNASSGMLNVPGTISSSGALNVGKLGSTNGHITASGNISSSGNIIADGIKATLPAGVDNSVVILDADGFLKTDEADGKIFTGVLGPDGSTTFGSSNNNKIPYISDGDNNLLDTSNLTHNAGGVSVTGHITASANVKVAGNIIANGNIVGDNSTDISGIDSITANSLNVTHFTSSFVTSSTIVTEGSNTFGDTIADQHTFNGHITASGNISASGAIKGGSLDINGGGSVSGDLVIGRHLSHDGDSDTKITFETNTISFVAGNTTHMGFTEAGGTQILTNITASGQISSSGNGYNDFGGRIRMPDRIEHTDDPNTALLFSDDSVELRAGGKKFFNTSGHITASGNISASGYLDVGVKSDSNGWSRHTFGAFNSVGSGTEISSGSMIRVGADGNASASLELFSSNKGWSFTTAKQSSAWLSAGSLRIISNRVNDVMTMTLSGDVGIGNANPSKALVVAGEISSSNAISVANTEVISGSGEILNRFQLSYDYNGRGSAANRFYTKGDRGGFANFSLDLGGNPSGSAVTYLTAARYSSYTAPRACKLIRMQHTMLNYTNDDDIYLGVYKGTAVNDSSANITLTQIGTDIGQAMDEDETFMFQTDFASGNELAAGDFILFCMSKRSHSGTAYPRFNINLELQYT